MSSVIHIMKVWSPSNSIKIIIIKKKQRQWLGSSCDHHNSRVNGSASRWADEYFQAIKWFNHHRFSCLWLRGQSACHRSTPSGWFPRECRQNVPNHVSEQGDDCWIKPWDCLPRRGFRISSEVFRRSSNVPWLPEISVRTVSRQLVSPLCVDHALLALMPPCWTKQTPVHCFSLRCRGSKTHISPLQLLFVWCWQAWHLIFEGLTYWVPR